MRLIDEDALTKRLVEFCNKNCPYTAKERNVMCDSCFMGLALEAVEDAPPIEERKTGKWIQFPNHMAYKCSECGRVIQTTNGQRNVSKHYPFCHCGADMRKEEMSE